jgi:galactokinase
MPSGASAVADAVVRLVPARAPGAVLVRAPGRVNLLGEHTDYNGLPVLPMAIDRAVYVAAWRGRGPRVHARNLDPALGSRSFGAAARIRRSAAGDWANYLKAAMQAAAADGAAGGVEMVIGSDLPAGAGLSSSSALLVASTLATLAVHGRDPDRLALAERLAVAERYVGTHSGGMDQAVILLAEAGRALAIDFFPLRARPVALPAGHAVVVAHSLIRAEKSGNARAAYNRRVLECRLATRVLAHALGVELERLGDVRTAFPGRPLTDFVARLADLLPDEPLALGDLAREAGLPPRTLEGLARGIETPPRSTRAKAGFRPVARARHVLTEAERVGAAVRGLEAPTFSDPGALLGDLMNASHASCRDDYAISVPELDALVDAARAADGRRLRRLRRHPRPGRGDAALPGASRRALLPPPSRGGRGSRSPSLRVRARGGRRGHASRALSAWATPATTVPIVVAVTRFQNMHGTPHAGVPSDTMPRGPTIRSPQRGPRSHHAAGQRVMPTRKPIASRATYHAHTTTSPRM